MDTAKNSLAESFKDKRNQSCSPASVMQRAHNEIISVIQNGPSFALLTGMRGKGKSTLLRKIGKHISDNSRLIFFNGTDLLSQHAANTSKQSKPRSRNNKRIQDFNVIKDFICESTELGEKLTLIVDAADSLPTTVLSDILEIYKQSSSKNYGLNIVLAGLPDFKNKLEEIKNVSVKDFIHCSIDELNAQDILALVAHKEFRNMPNGNNIIFTQDVLEKLSEYVKGDQQVLDVLLEWCSALAQEDGVNTVTKHILKRATAYAELFSKDKKITLAESYPPPKDFHNYIGSHKLINKSLYKEKDAEEPIKLANNDFDPSSIPTMTFELDDSQNASLHEIDDLEEEVMPAQWIAAPKKSSPSKSIALLFSAVVLALFIGLIFLISQRLQTNQTNIEQAAVNDPDQEVKTEISESTNALEAESVQQGLITENINSLADIGNKNFNNASTDNSTNTAVFSQTEDIDLNSTEKADNSDLAQYQHESMVEDDHSIAIEEKIDPSAKDSSADILVLNNGQSAENQNIEQAIVAAPASDIHKENSETSTSDTRRLNQTEITDQLDAFDDIEIDALLKIAAQQFDAKKLTTPIGDTAYETYQTILEKNPNHAAAQQGIRNIHDRYVRWANYYLQQSQTKRAKYFYSKALEVDPKDETTIQIIKNLANPSSSINLTATQTGMAESKNIQAMLNSANQIMQQITTDTTLTQHSYNVCQQSLGIYRNILKAYPNNATALAGLTVIKSRYISWAELEISDANYNLALFLYGKALSIEPNDNQIVKRLKEIQSLTK